MKYAQFKFNGESKIGIQLDNYLVDIQRAYALYLKTVENDSQADAVSKVIIPNDFVEFLEAGEYSWNEAKNAYNYISDKSREILGINEEMIFYSIDSVKLLPPIKPRTIMCPGPDVDTDKIPNGEDYLEFFLKAQDTVVAPNSTINVDANVGKIGFQPELGLVFGCNKRYVEVDAVEDCIFGYTILNNIYSIDRLVVGWEGTMFHVRYGEGASFDNSAPIGPWVVTKDELLNIGQIKLQKQINGVTVEEASISDLRRTANEFVSYCSTFFPLQPSILISSGYPKGPILTVDNEQRPIIKHTLTEGSEVRDGSVLACVIDGLGKLENTVRMPRG